LCGPAAGRIVATNKKKQSGRAASPDNMGVSIMSDLEAAAAATIDEPYVGPVRSKERFSSIDIVRGVALFGILLMNIVGFGHGLWYEEFQQEGAAQGANLWSWIITSTFFEGTQRTLFSILFGAGVIILTSRAEKAGGGIGVADIYYRRNIWLIAFGMVNAYLLLWDGDILFFYGVVALFLFPMRNMLPKHLFLVGALGLLALIGVYQYDASEVQTKQADYIEAQAVLDGGGELDEEQQEAIDSWEEALKDFNFDEESRAEQIENHATSYITLFKHHLPGITDLHGNILYRYLFLDVFSMMVIGMALLKLGVLTLERSTKFYWLMVLAGYGVGVPVSLWETNAVIAGGYGIMSEVDTIWTYDIGRLGNATGHLGLLLLFVRSGWLSWLQVRLAAVGRMALTNYIMHSLIAMVVFLRPGFGLYGRLERYELYYVVLAICVFQLLVSKPWLDRYRFGPLEWLWRSLTYLEKQPMRHHVVEDSAE